MICFLGVADLNDERIKSVSAIDYFKHLILFSDQRFAKDIRFRYHASNLVLRKQALQKGRIFVQNNSNVANMNADQLKEALIQSPSLYKKVMHFNSNLRSTPSYWHARSTELEDMVKQEKAPTLFFTLSAADVHWPELYR